MNVRALLGVVVFAAGSVACADLLGFKELRQADAGDGAPPFDAGDGGTDAGSDGDTCAHVRWPSSPAADDPGGDPDAGGAWGYVLAVHHMYFSTAPDGGSAGYGYDLDDRCTTGSGSASCSPPAAADPTTLTDGVGGADGQSIHLMQQLQSFVPSLTDQSLNDEVAAGRFTLLLRLFQYRGLANQTVGSGLLFGVQSSPGTNGAVTPNFDGNDTWHVATDDTLGGATEVPVIRTAAYVKNDTLVVSFPGAVTVRVLLPATGLATGPLTVRLNEPTVTASLVKRNDGRYDIANGVLTGRWSIDAMIQALGELTVNNGAFCALGSTYDNIRGTICSQRDIAAHGAQDNTNAPCDAVSVALGFDAVAAQISGQVQFPVTTTPCADAGTCN